MQEMAPACRKSPGSGAGFDHVINVVMLWGLSEWVTFSLVVLHCHLDLPILTQISLGTQGFVFINIYCLPGKLSPSEPYTFHILYRTAILGLALLVS